MHDLESALGSRLVYDRQQVATLTDLYLAGADRPRLDPILDGCVATYRDTLDENAQVAFKGDAKAFVRTYAFLSTILPYTSAEWERLSIFLNFLIPKLPAPQEEDLSKGVLEAIDMDSCRAEKQAMQAILLHDADGEIEPVPTTGGGRRPDPEIDRLSRVVHAFNDLFGAIDWVDRDRLAKTVAEDLPARVAADEAYRNACENSGKDAAKLELGRALNKTVVERMKDEGMLFKQFSDNPEFKRWLIDYIFAATYAGDRAVPGGR